MLSKYDIKNFIKRHPDKFPYMYNEEGECLYDKETGDYVCTLDTFIQVYRKENGESFESVYYEHVMLINVLRCTECGTVIFTYEDERYDPHLQCPTCTDYEPSFKYWTKEDIESDADKQSTIREFEEMTKRQIESNKRIERRKGLYDWQIARKKFCGKKLFLSLTLECNDITKSYLKGLRLEVRVGRKDNDDGMLYTIKHFFTIPLSWSQFYIQFIYRHLGKCHPDIRSKWYIGKPMESSNKIQ